MKRVLILLVLAAFLHAEDIYATFNVEAKRSANLAFSIGGIVDKVFVDVGSKVKKKQILAKLENRDLKAALRLNKTELKYAKRDFARAQKAKGALDSAAFDKFAYRKDIAKVKVALEQIKLDKTYLKAPFDGVITYKNIEKGDVVTAMNPRVVYKIQSQKRRVLKISFDQKYASIVKVGDIFEYKLDDNNKTFKAKITKIYPTIDAKTQKARAEAESFDIMVGKFGDGYIKVQR
jgi:RND family efflux transporter MFP subunit